MQARRQRPPRWSNWLIPVAVLGVLIPLGFAIATGNIAIPHNDSWSYSRTAEIFAHSWTIHLVDWANMTLIGQVVMLGPLGSSIVVQQITVALLSLVVLYCVYDLVSDVLGAERAAFATLITAFWPGFGLLATSFMTDIPALAGTFGALAVGRHAIRRDSPRLFYLSLVIAFWAATIREQSLAAPAVVIVYGLLTRHERTRLGAKQLIGGAVLFGVLLLPLLAWRSGLPNADNPVINTAAGPYWRLLRTLAPRLYFTVAFGVSPAVALTVRPLRWRWPSWLAAGIAAAVAIAVIRSPGGELFAGNYLSPYGEYTPVMGGYRIEFGGHMPEIFNDVFAVSGILMAGTLAERWRRAEPMLTAFTLITAVITVLIGSGGLGLYDRYLLALIPGTLAITLAKPGRFETGDWRERYDRAFAVVCKPLSAAAFLFLAVISVLMIGNAFGFDIARWHAGQSLTKSTRLAAGRVNAGLEWNGYHGADGIIALPAPCVELLSSANPGAPNWTLMRTFPYRTFLLSGHSELYAYNTHAPGCPKSLTR